MSEQVWSSEERRVALEQVSRMISERVEKARVQRGEISVEACEDHQAMQVAIELQCRLTIAIDLLRRASDLMENGAPDDSWFTQYFGLTGEHAILTEEGWQPGDSKASIVEEYGEDAVLDEVNAPEIQHA